MEDKKKTIVIIDGFNLYHAIADLRKPYLKWLDLWALSSALAHPTRDELVGVFYCSAYATWFPEKCRRHQIYVSALKATKVTPILGQFKEKRLSCKSCRAKWIGHEEKESDVNLAIHLVHMAHMGIYDKAIVITADTDITPAITMVRETFPLKEVFVAIPKARKRYSQALQHSATGTITIQDSHFEKNLLPHEVSDDHRVIIRPPEYAPPA
jgi:hypothetical protein